MIDQSSRDALRALVQEVLRDALPQALAEAPTASLADSVARTQVVRLAGDDDLDAFVRRLVGLLDDPEQGAALRSGALRFSLAAPTGTAPAAAAEPAAPGPVRIDKGAVTEAQVRQASSAGARLVLGRAAVLTPLARDAVRTLGVTVEKER